MTDNEIHSAYGGSSIGRVIACPGSVAMCASAPKRLPGKAANAGTYAHRVLEYCINEKLRTSVELVDRRLSASLDDEPIPHEMSEAVDVFLEAFWAIVDRDPEARVYVEERFDFVTPNLPRGEAFGKADTVVYLPTFNELHVLDFKYGEQVSIRVEGNPQLKFYACGAAMFGEHAKDWSIQKITIYVVQPRAWDADVNGAVRAAEMDLIDLLEFPAEVDRAVVASKHSGAPLNPGEHQCKFCDGAVICPAVGARMLEAAAASYSDIVETTPKALPEVDKMSLDRIERVLEVAEFVRAWLSAVERRAEELAMSGVGFERHKVVAKKGRSKLKGDDEMIAAAVSLMFGVPIDSLLRKKLVGGITGVKAAINSALSDKEMRKKAIEHFTLAYTSKESTGLELVPLSDPRPVVDALSHYRDVTTALNEPG